MGVIYRYLASGVSGPSSPSPEDASSSSRTARLTRQVYRLFPSSSTNQKPTKEDTLALTSIQSHDILFNVSRLV